MHPASPVDVVDGAGQISGSQFELAHDRRHVLLINPLRVFSDTDFRDLALQPGVLVDGLSRLGRDLLVEQPVLDSGLVEFADELALLHFRVGWKN